MPNSCPTCGQALNHPLTRCAQCGLVDDSGELEPAGWWYVTEPGRPTAEATLPDGKPVSLPRRVLICDECYHKGLARDGISTC